MEYFGRSPVPLPVLILGKAAFLGCGLFFIVKLLRPEAMLLDSAFTTAAGGALCAAGLAVLAAGIVHLGRSIAVGLPERGTELRTDGIYRFTRNPIYLGGFIACAGSCLVAIHPLNILLFCIAVAVHLGIVRREEEFLERRFGERWLEYKRRVPRFIGAPRRI